MTLAQLDAEHPVDYALHVADWEREQQTCGKCGRPIAQCSDSERVWYPQRTICYADMEAASVRWKYQALHGETSNEQFHDGTFKNWSKNRSDAFPYAHDDGVSLWVSAEDLTPDDDFLGSPATPSDDEAVS